MFLCEKRPLALTINPIGQTGGITSAARYDSIGRPTEEDPPGRHIQYAIPYSIGIVKAVSILDRPMECMVLSRNSQQAAQSSYDLWRRGLHLPLFAATQTRPSLSDQIVIFGGRTSWEHLREMDKGIKEDALRRATPRGV